MKPYRSYEKDLINDLKGNTVEAFAYLNAALEEGDQKAFLLALRHVIEAYGGMTHFSRVSGIHRVSLYKIFSKKGNPEFGSLMTIFKTLGMTLHLSTNTGKTKNYKKAA